ncbi:MAG: hypothetical protein ABL911_08745 [Gallionella sp.]
MGRSLAQGASENQSAQMPLRAITDFIWIRIGTTSHLTKQLKNGCQVVAYGCPDQNGVSVRLPSCVVSVNSLLEQRWA